MNDFQQELQSSPSPKSLKYLLMMVTPPKGVSRKASADEVLPLDEGTELFDYKGEEIEVDKVRAFNIDDKISI